VLLFANTFLSLTNPIRTNLFLEHSRMSWGSEFYGSSKLAKGQAVLGGLLFLTGVVMVVGGVVLLALDCQLEKPWVLLVWGLVTCLMYGLVMWAGANRWDGVRVLGV